MITLLHEPWPWYIGGPAISLVMFLLIFFGKEFGISANFRATISLLGGGKISSFFDFDWKSQSWNLVFGLGVLIGAFLTRQFLTTDEPMALSAAFLSDLERMGVEAPVSGELEPLSLFNFGQLTTLTGIMMIVAGGFFIGFGARYAGGCTSGHAISGISNLQLPSLLAVGGFFIGGLFVTHIVYPWLLNF